MKRGKDATQHRTSEGRTSDFYDPFHPSMFHPPRSSVAVNKAMEEDAIILHKSGAITTHPWICRPNATLTKAPPNLMIVCPGFLRLPEARSR